VSLRVAVLGSGVTGMSAALGLARAGHRVDLVERDRLEVGGATEAIGWTRTGIPHFLQAHAFTSRGRLVLRTRFPDVFDALLEAGAEDQDLRHGLRGTSRPGDEHLRFLGVRRPLIEWALRRAVVREPAIRVHEGVQVSGLDAEPGAVPRVRGVATSAGVLRADLVVDALGRRSPVQGWIAGLGGTPLPEETSDCGVLYYTRYYRVREGVTLSDGPFIPSPRGDLGYGLFSTFRGDNRTFAALIAIPPGDQDLKRLRHVAAYEAASRLMPALHDWTHPDRSTPITDVLPMGSLQNTIRRLPDGRPAAVGLVSVGDALFHTDPVFALGMSFALVEADALVEALEEHGTDTEAVVLAFDRAMRPDLEERYRFATDLDALRLRVWRGERFDVTRSDGEAYPLFISVAGGVAALADGDIFRAILRRNFFLDPLSVVDGDRALLARIEALFAEARGRPRPAAGPPRDELIAAMRAAVGD